MAPTVQSENQAVPSGLNHSPKPSGDHSNLSEHSNGVHSNGVLGNAVLDNGVHEIKPDRKVIGIAGYWYDITDFIHKHPGGPIIERFVGKDATAVFQSQLHKDVLKNRKPIGTYEYKHKHPIDEDIDKLRDFFEKNGFFQTDWSFYAEKWSLCALLLGITFFLFTCEEWYWHYLGGLILTAFWHQSGFLMHDTMHSNMFRTRWKDQLAGLVCGTTNFGISAHWWQDEHIVHHAMTNTVNLINSFHDPQMVEPVWAQHHKLFPLFQDWLGYILVKVQYITFTPIVMVAGRFAILFDSYKKETRPREWLAIIIHWSWISFLFSFLPTWERIAVVYAICAITEGILHFQLVFSHYCKDFFLEDEYHDMSWNVHQIICNVNITNNWYTDWFFGGLNFHIEHHLFPKMGREKFREASPYVRAVCEKHGIQYDSSGFWELYLRTLGALRKCSKHFTLDPR